MKKYYLPVIIILVMLAIGYYLWSLKSAANGGNQANQGGGLPVVAYNVGTMSLSDDISAVGTLQANEAVTVKSEIPGKIDRIDFTEGQLVQKGELIIEIDSRAYEQEVDRTKAAYDLAQSTYQRSSDLSRVGAASKQSRDEARSSYIESKAAYEKANIDYSKTKIQAPFDGMIGMRAVSSGDYLNVGSVITEIVAINPIKVEFALPEKYFSVLREGLPVFVTVDSWPNKQFEGTIYAISPQIDEATRNIIAKAVIKNDDKLLRPGMFGYVTIHVSVNEKALMIPEEALIPNGDKFVVMRIVDGKVVSGEVKIGIRRKGMVEITSGLAEGDSVITAGHMKVRDGMPVTAMPDERQMPAQPAPAAETKPENTTGK